MKKIYVGIIFGVFALASFMALNVYTSTSFPGYGNNEECNYCHNQPALMKTVQASFAMSDFAGANAVFTQYGQWSTDEVPIIPTNNRSDANLEFASVTFLKNSTSIMVKAQVPDKTPTALGTGSATSDKFGFIFNIDVVNFTVGQFLTNYNSSQTNLDNVLSGQMAFSTGGHADFWYVDVGKFGTNTTGKALDEAISSGITNDGATHQDVSVGIWYGNLGHGSVGYQYFFVRALNTGDPNDAQFNVDGAATHYAIASWDASSGAYHHSSFDQLIIVGNNFNVVSTITVTATSSKTSGTTSSFTVVFVLLGLAVSIPVIAHYRKRIE